MSKTNLVLIRSLIVNTLLVLLKIIIGIIGSSKVMIADGIHSLSDLSTDIVAIFGNHMAEKPADNKHPFGHGKIEYLTSIIIGSVILALAIVLIVNAFSSTYVIPNKIILYVTIFTIIIKYILSSYILKSGKKYQNSILIASGNESRADVLTSVVVIISYLFSTLTKVNKIFVYSDAVGTIIVALFILKTSYNILKENIISIIGEIETNEEYINNIKNIIKTNNNIKRIDELEIMKYGSYYQANITISVKEDLTIKQSNKIKNDIKNKLINKETRISYIKIMFNPYGGK